VGSAIVAASLLLFCACLAYVALTAGELPDPMVTQVDFEGNPTGRMGRTAFLWVFPGFVIGLNALFWALRPLLDITPDSMISTPWQDYWFASAERRAEAISRLKVVLVGHTALFVNAISLLVYHLIYQKSVPGVWPPLPDWLFLPILCVASLAYIACMILYMKPPAGQVRTH